MSDKSDPSERLIEYARSPEGDPLERLIEYAIAHAAANPDLAEDLIGFLKADLASRRVPDPRLADYFVACFDRILAVPGEPAAKALNLVRPKGRGKNRQRTLEQMDTKHLMAASAVSRCRRSGMTEREAVRHVARLLDMGISTVQHAYDHFRRATDANATS